MIYDTEKYVEKLVKLQITPNQFLLCWMIYNKQWKLIGHYMDNFGSFNISEIRDLIDKSLILNLAKDSSTFTTRDLVVTEIFANEMIVDPDEAWKEFFSKYPGKLIVNNVSFAAKGLTLTEETRLEEKYKEIVGNNKYEHNNIISLLEKWKNSNGGFATMKIDKFIIGEYWKEIETERDSHVGPALF